MEATHNKHTWDPIIPNTQNTLPLDVWQPNDNHMTHITTNITIKLVNFGKHKTNKWQSNTIAMQQTCKT